jgi:hypothetical protein
MLRCVERGASVFPNITMSSLAGTIDVIAPHLAEALVSAAALARLRTVSADLPAALTNRVYVECRATDDAPEADLIISVARPGWPVLASASGPLALGVPIRRAPGWKPALSIARAWGDPRHRLHDAIRRLWLEFDLDVDETWRTSVERPGIFVDFAPQVYTHASRAERLAAAHDALTAAGGAADCSIDVIRRCIAALPAEGRMPYIGIFPGRDAAMVRACVTGLTDREVEPYLDAVGWTGSPVALGDMLALLSAHPDLRGHAVTVLHLDLAVTVRPRLGLERTLGRDGQAHGRIGDTDLLDALVAAGWCSSAKRCALAAWPGVATRVMPHELWPAVVARRVNHIKVVGGDDQPPRAKLYLCATHRYLNRRAGADGRQDVPPISPPQTTRQSIR